MSDTASQDAPAPEPVSQPATPVEVRAEAPVEVDESYVAPNLYTPVAPYAGQSAYTPQNPYAAHNPYVAQNPYPAPGPTGYAPAPQPVPTMPAPPVLMPYTTAGQAYAYGPRTNPLAIASLAVSLGAIIVGLLASIVGVVLGHIALRQIAQRGEAGRGLALGGLITGYVLGGLSLLFWIAYFGLIASFFSYSSY